MSAFIDLSGQRFGMLVVIKRVKNTKRNATKFLCKCDCGKEVIRLSSSLKSGDAIGCGCWRNLPYGEGAFRSFYRYTALNAKYRKIKFNLSLEFFGWITKQPCRYCGAEPSYEYGQKRNNGKYIYNGIDRVDNNVGYVKENCVPCCGHCNYMKSAVPVEKFRDWIVRVYHHWASRP